MDSEALYCGLLVGKQAGKQRGTWAGTWQTGRNMTDKQVEEDREEQLDGNETQELNTDELSRM